MASRRSRWRSRQLSTGLTPSRSYQAARGASVSRARRVAVSTMSGTLSAIETSQQRAPDALRQKDHEGHEDRTDHDRPPFDEATQALLQHQKGERPDEGSRDAPRGSRA